MRTLHTPALPAYLRHSTLVAALGIALAPLASTAAIQSYTVTTGADGGTGSLREILTTINNDMNCSIDDYAINFSGPFTIAPSIPLPALQCPRTTINANDMAGVVIDGINYSYGGTCVLNNTSSGVAVIKKLRLERFNFTSSVTGFCGQVHALGNNLSSMYLGMSLSAGALADGNTLSNVADGIRLIGAGTIIRNNVNFTNNEGISADGDMYGGRPTVDSNTVSGAAAEGFSIGISANDALEVKNNNVQQAYIGISVNGSGLAVIGNTVIGNYYGGIVADNGALVEGNFVGGNETGIYANDVTLRGNFVGTFGGRLGNQIGIADTSAGIGSIIEDNFVSGNSTTGIYLDGFGGIVRGNKVGTNEAGTAALPNDGPGVFVTRFAFDYQITGNTISGNNNAGIFVEADGLGLSITDNRIGTNSTGSGGLGNATMGIDLPCGGAEISIKGNTISGNGSHGVWLGGVTGDPTSGSIENNYIGTASGGGGLIPNGGNGVTLAMLLGGAACSPPALQAAKAGSAKTRQQQAKMERRALSAATAEALQPKALQPKALNMSATNFVPVVGNTIKNNVGSGIEVRDDGQGNHWFANSISANRVKNIDLNGGAALANDDGDIDAGNNLKQNYAEIVSVQQTAANTTEISFTLKSESADTVGCPTTPPASGYVYRIDFYTNPGATTPAGDNPLIAANTFLPGAPCGGVVSGGYTLNGHYDFISLTTRNESTSNSSEFSNVMAAVAAPAVAFNPALPVSFGQVPMFGSASRTVTLTSVGGQPWRFSSFSTDSNCGRVLGSKAATSACTAPFTCDTTCVPGTDVPSGGSCALNATFAPTATGTVSQTIYLCDNAHTAGHPVTLTGEGLPAAVATITPNTWNFGSVRVGQKSALKSFSVVNENPVATTIQAITASGDFVRESTTCPTAPATLAAGQGCEVVVSFLPAVAGAANGTLRLSSGGGGLSDATAALQGNGTQVAEIALPSSVDFGTYTLGAAPIVRSITITNTGNTDVVFSAISASAPWTLTHGCGTQLAPNASCTFSLGFAPSTAGTYTGNLTVSSNAQGSGSVALSGTAQEAPVPLATLSSNTIDLGSVPVGTTSNPGSITLTSTGTAPYVISKYSSDSSCSTAASVCTSGEFLCSLGCNPGQSYVAGSSCTISARFAPQSVGPRSTTFFICDNTTASPRAVTIKGQGSNPLVVGLAPAAHDFGVVPVGQSSPARTFTIVNSSGGTVTISAPFASANFRVLSHTCPASLGPSQRCSAEVAFVPTLAGALSGQLVIQTSGAGTASAFATLTGVGGTQPVLDLTSALDFGSVQAGSGAVTRTATVTNTGNAPLTLSSVTLTGTFYALQNECPATVAAGASCSIRVTFTPTESGEFNGTLTVVGNVSGGPRTVALTGRAQPRPVPLVRVTPANMGFGDRQIGSQSAAQRITVSNVGGAAAAIDSITVGPDYVVAANNCGNALAAQQSCIIELALRPVGFGPRVGQLQVFTNSDGSPHTVNLTGTGCRPFTPGSRNNNGRNAACAP